MREGTNKPGFTIIELVITLAIIVLLVSVGIPRYNGTILRQQFRNSGQQFVTCMTQAHQAAVDPQTIFGSSAANTTVYYTAAILSQSGTTAFCQIQGYDKNQTIISTLSPAVTGKSWTATDTQIGIITTDIDPFNLDHNFANPVEIFYSAQRLGYPSLLRIGGVPITRTSTKVSYDGFRVTVNLSSVKLSTVTAQVNMERLGLPVVLSVSDP